MLFIIVFLSSYILHSSIARDLKKWQIRQKIDHNSNKSAFFNQHYYYYKYEESEAYYLYINGEFALRDPFFFVGREGFLLESRCFGDSLLPGKFMEMKELCNFNQMFNDTVHFIKKMSRNSFHYKKWIIVGYSLGGYLAACFKQVWPDLVAGAIVLGAPVHWHMELDYETHLLESLSINNPKCHEGYMTLIKQLETAIGSTQALQKLNLTITIQAPIESIDAGIIFWQLLEKIHESFFSGHVDFVCDSLMKDPNTTLENAFTFTGQKTIAGNLDNYLKILNETQEEKNNHIWEWLRCNELGLLSYTSNLHPYIDLETSVKICQYLWGSSVNMNQSIIISQHENFNKSFPLLPNWMSNIFFSTGDYDPWLPISWTDEIIDKNILVRRVKGSFRGAYDETEVAKFVEKVLKSSKQTYFGLVVVVVHLLLW